jgi:uncharacterized membrane protein YecN with MAPEG domain
MTEFEALELIDILQSRVASSSMDCITVFFAYVVCVYLVGKKLVPKMAIGISVLFSCFMLGPMTAIAVNAYNLSAMATRYEDKFGLTDIWLGPAMSPVLTVSLTLVPLILAWVAALWYLHGYVRK